MNDYVKNKWVYGIIWLTVLAIIVWIIAGTRKPEIDNNIPVNQETYTMESSTQEISSESPTGTNSYYMVKAENGIVTVFWIDGTGEHLHRETNIAFSLLSLEDQKLLEDGIVLESDEELASFLENYDS